MRLLKSSKNYNRKISEIDRRLRHVIQVEQNKWTTIGPKIIVLDYKRKREWELLGWHNNNQMVETNTTALSASRVAFPRSRRMLFFFRRLHFIRLHGIIGILSLKQHYYASRFIVNQRVSFEISMKEIMSTKIYSMQLHKLVSLS